MPSPLPFVAALLLCKLAAFGTPAALVGALAVSLAVWSALRTLVAAHRTCWAAAMLALPIVALGAGMLASADALGTAACLMSLDAAVRRHHATMLMWFGIGFGFAGEAVLLAPLVAALLLHRRVHPALLMLVPIGHAMVMVIGPVAPDMAAPRTVAALCGGAPGIGCVVASLLPAQAPRLAGLAITAALGAAACFVAHFSVRLPAARLLPTALLATLLTGGLLPQIHADAFLLVAMVAGLSAAATGTRRDACAAVLVQTGFGLALVGQPVLGFVAVAVATWLVAAPDTRRAANDNPIMMPLLRPLATGRPPER